MSLKRLFTCLLVCASITSSFGQYNPLIIPDTLSGTVFNLAVKDTFKQFLPGNQTVTGGVNWQLLGPDLNLPAGRYGAY